MRITVTRSGGFAGMMPPPVTIDTAALPADTARRLEELAADFFALPQSLGAPARQADRFQYTIRVVHDNGREHTVTCNEDGAPEDVLEMVRLVQKETH
ncbi:MAG: protealysin inhibitor emfourin [Verrucomicrobiota bacterium]